MRYFKLVNSRGAEWDLMARDGFFHAPSGLGFARSISTLRAGNDWLPSNEFLNQKTPSGEMVFFSYESYQRFVSFISYDEPLFLMYQPTRKWYRCRCKVSKLEKGDMTNPGLLVCPIVFSCLGTWHELVSASQADINKAAGKVYPYAYPYSYADSTVVSAAIENGNLESPCKLHIFGPCTNPAWSISQGGETLQRGRVFATIPEDHKLVVAAAPAEMEIAEYTRNNVFVRDLYAASDFSTERFIYAPPGSSTVSVTGENTDVVRATVEVEKLAYSV